MNKETLAEKEQIFEGWHSKENRFFHINYVKEKVQNAERRIEERFKDKERYNAEYIKFEIDKIFKEEFGGKLTNEKM